MVGVWNFGHMVWFGTILVSKMCLGTLNCITSNAKLITTFLYCVETLLWWHVVQHMEPGSGAGQAQLASLLLSLPLACVNPCTSPWFLTYNVIELSHLNLRFLSSKTQWFEADSALFNSYVVIYGEHSMEFSHTSKSKPYGLSKLLQFCCNGLNTI